MTSHDREFMNRIVRKIIEIDGGTLTTYSGNSTSTSSSGRSREAAPGAVRAPAGDAGQGDQVHRALQGARLHAAQVQSRVKKLDKIEKVEPPRRRQSVQFEFRSPPRSGEDVVSFRGVHKGYGSQPIYGARFPVRRKERWCVLGANGAGKSTLLKLVPARPSRTTAP
jgi:ATPase subunit of ABC transporter with duplicated ATPase domains